MKNLILIFTLAMLMISLTGCVTVSYTMGSGIMVGKGDIITVDFPVSEIGEFTKVNINLHAKLHFIKTDSEPGGVRIELHENLAEHLNVHTMHEVLFIESDRNFRAGGNSDSVPQVYISAQSLDLLIISGVIEIGNFDTITGDTFSLGNSGVISGDALELDVKELTVNISGVGSLNLIGSAEKVNVESSGVGHLNALELASREMVITLSGVGSAEVYCIEKLEATMSGVGSIRYKGNPEVNQIRIGVGNISRID
ncbi:MAG: DUF2807 domain-containing protein [Oscillospiraceae bacterium]|nr:DUF2807 domain-containing protein [Oscillospiraceae bacterium]